MQRDLTAAAPQRAASWAQRPTLGRPGAHIAVLLLYIILTIVLAWPTVTHLTSAVPGPPDANGAWLYDLWETRQSLASLVEGGHLPDPGRPATASLGIANRLLALPCLLLGDEVLAYNALALLSFVLTAYAGFLLVIYITGNPYAAAVSGCILAFAPLRMHWLATGQLPLLSTQWIPLTFLSLERALREHRRRYGLLAGAFFGLTMLSSWTYLPLVGGAVLLYTLVRLYPWKARSNRTARQALLPGVLVATACVAGMLLLGQPIGGIAVSASTMVDPSPGLDDLLTPSAYHPFWGERFAALRPATPTLPDGVPGYAYLGLIATLLALMGLTDGDSDEPRTRSGMVWIGVIFGLFALGPVLKVFGQAVSLESVPALGERLARSLTALGVPAPAGGALPLPAVLLYRFVSPTTAAELIRAAPILPTLALAVMAGIGTATMVGSRTPAATPRPRWDTLHNPLYAAMRPTPRWEVGSLLGAATLILLVAIDYAAVPLATGSTIPRDGALVQWLSSQPGEGTVIYYPLERTMNGYTLYASRGLGKEPARALVAATPRETLAAFPSAGSVAFLRSHGVGYIVVDADAAVAGRPAGNGLPSAIEAATGLTPAAVISDEPAWEIPASGTFAWETAGGLAGPGSLLVYTLQ